VLDGVEAVAVEYEQLEPATGPFAAMNDAIILRDDRETRRPIRRSPALTLIAAVISRKKNGRYGRTRSASSSTY
jgi:hypothetical protein